MIVRNTAGVLTVGTLTISDGATPAGVSAVVTPVVAGDGWRMTLVGVPVPGEVWKSRSTALNASVTVTAGMGLADIVAAMGAGREDRCYRPAQRHRRRRDAARREGRRLGRPADADGDAVQWHRAALPAHGDAVGFGSVLGDTWSFTIDGVTVTHTVTDADLTEGPAAALVRIAGKLAKYINDRNGDPVSEPNTFAGYSAVASGASIVITTAVGPFAVAGTGVGTYDVSALASSTRTQLADDDVARATPGR